MVGDLFLTQSTRETLLSARVVEERVISVPKEPEKAYVGKHRDPDNKRRPRREEADPQIWNDLRAAHEMRKKDRRG